MRNWLKKAYGRFDETTLQAAREHNPEVTDVNQINVGQELVFPRPREQARAGREVTNRN